MSAPEDGRHAVARKDFAVESAPKAASTTPLPSKSSMEISGSQAEKGDQQQPPDVYDRFSGRRKKLLTALISYNAFISRESSSMVWLTHSIHRIHLSTLGTANRGRSGLHCHHHQRHHRHLHRLYGHSTIDLVAFVGLLRQTSYLSCFPANHGGGNDRCRLFPHRTPAHRHSNTPGYRE